MRKLLISLLAVSAVLAMTANIASSATKASAAPKKCGTLYKPPCKKPTVAVASIASCQNTGRTLHFPVSVSANAGLRSATVKFRGKTIASKKFPGNPTSASFTATLSTRGFRPSLFTLVATVTDTRGKTASKSAHFTICTPAPVFTG